MADVQSQLDNRPHDNMVTTIRVILFIMVIMTLVVCLLRLYIRYFIIRSVGYDDIFVIPALMGLLCWHAVAISETFHGLGRHIWDIEPADFSVWLKEFYITECIYLIVALLLKTSIILFVMRLFPERYLHIACKSLIAFLVTFTISGALILVFQCKPVRAAYNPGLPGSKCFSADTMFAIFMYQAVAMFLTDVVIVLMPMPILWRLNMSLKKRIAVMILFGLGSVATIAALVRFSTLAFVKGGTDVTYTSSQAYIWMSIEFSLGLTTGSLSSLRPIITWKGVEIFSRKHSRGYSTSSRPKSGTKPHSNGYIQHVCAGGTELSSLRGQRIMKTTTFDVEFVGSESVERIITTSDAATH